MGANRSIVGELAYTERMPALAPEKWDEAQRTAAEALIRGPRGAMTGPFVPLLRSPELMERLAKVGEYLRFGAALDTRIGELAMLFVAREWTNQFEWAIHVPVALKRGMKLEVIEALAQGRRPQGMTPEEAIAYDVCEELSRTRCVCDATYDAAVGAFGEAGLVDLVSLYGYFVTVCAIMNVAHTPAPAAAAVPPLLPYPL